MRIVKIICGSIITILFSVSFLGNVGNLFRADADHISFVLGTVVGSGLVLFLGVALLVSGIRKRTFGQAFTRKQKTTPQV